MGGCEGVEEVEGAAYLIRFDCSFLRVLEYCLVLCDLHTLALKVQFNVPLLDNFEQTICIFLDTKYHS